MRIVAIVNEPGSAGGNITGIWMKLGLDIKQGGENERYLLIIKNTKEFSLA